MCSLDPAKKKMHHSEEKKKPTRMAKKLQTLWCKRFVMAFMLLFVAIDLSLPTVEEEERRAQERNWKEAMDFLETKFSAVVDYESDFDQVLSHMRNRTRTTCRWTAVGEDVSRKVADCLHQKLPNYTNAPPELLFFGDSTMARLWYNYYHKSIPYFMPLHTIDSCNCEMRVLDRCYESENFNREPIFPDKLYGNERRRPNLAQGEGPTSHGIGTGFARGCMDCSSCHSRLWFCSDKCKYTAPSFFGVEFSRDVEIQTIRSPTTQEATADLLKTHYTSTLRQKLCVVNVGMHDFTIRNMTKNIYIRNVKWYLTLLKPRCDHLLWISLSQVVELDKYPQNNAAIVEWNEAIEKMLHTPDFKKWTSSLDVFKVTSVWTHENPVHLKPGYYQELAAILAKAVFVHGKPAYFQ